MMCELKEELFGGFGEAAENNQSDDEDSGWMLSAYCGSGVLKKKHFHVNNVNKLTKTNDRTDVQTETCINATKVHPKESSCKADTTIPATDKVAIINDKKIDDAQAENPTAQQPNAAETKVVPQPNAVIPQLRKRTASYAFVSSEPESNNNKSLFGDAYASSSSSCVKEPRVSPSKDRCADGDTYEDKDYIFENPYLVEYRNGYHGDSGYSGDCDNYQQVLDMEYRTSQMIRQRVRGNLTNQDAQMVIKEMKKTANFNTAEKNTLSSDLNRDLSDYVRSHNQRLRSSDVEWWRITRHLELTCIYVLMKLRQSSNPQSWRNRRKKSSSSGGINQTLLAMSMGDSLEPQCRSELFTKQQLDCVDELKDFMELVLVPELSENVKIENIITLFQKLKEKFNLDKYENEIICYGIETMNDALKNELQVNSPEVVRCLQEVCDLMKQITQQHQLALNVPAENVPSLLEIEVKPTVNARLFSVPMARSMRSIYCCLMEMYRSDDETEHFTNAQSDDDNQSQFQTDNLSLVSENIVTFPNAINSSEMAALPVINTFDLGITYEYSKKNETIAESENNDTDTEKAQGLLQCDNTEKPPNQSSSEFTDVAKNQNVDSDICTNAEVESNDVSNQAFQEESTHSEKPESNMAISQNQAESTAPAVDVDTRAATNAEEAGEPFAPDPETIDKIDSKMYELNEATSSETYIHTVGNSATTDESSNNESKDTDSQNVCQEAHQDFEKEQYFKTALDYPDQAEQDQDSKVHFAETSNYVPSDVESSRLKSEAADDVIQGEAALDLSVRKK